MAPPAPNDGFTPAFRGFKVVPVDEQTVNLVTTIGPSSGATAINWAALFRAVMAALPAILAILAVLTGKTVAQLMADIMSVVTGKTAGETTGDNPLRCGRPEIFGDETK